MLVSVIMIPYIIAHIGKERFGIWAIISIVTGYCGLLDFGVGASFVKYIAELYTKKDYDDISNIINTGFTLYALLALVTTAFILLFVGPLLTLFNIPQYLRHEAAVVLIIGVALFGASNAASPFISIQGGLQRMDISNKIGIALSIVNIAGTMLVLEQGFGIIGLMLNNVFVFIIAAIINVWIAFRILPELRFRLFGFNSAVFKRIFRFGCNVQVARVSGTVANQTDKIFIGCLLSVGVVTYYQLGSSIVYYLGSVAAIMTSAIMPAFSEIEANGERQRLVEAYLRSVKCLSLVTVPLFVFVIASAFQIMAIWMGQGYEMAGLIVQILALAWVMPTIAQVSVYVSFAIDRPQFMAASAVIVIALNLVLSFAFIKIFGFYGAAWGTMIAVNIGTAYFLYKLNVYLQASFKKFAGVILPYVAIGIASAAVVVFIDGIVALFHMHPGRLQMLAIFIARGAVFSALYLLGVIRFGLFDRADTELLRKLLPFGLGAAKGLS
jgi:O-antigen/teichoic acid export membrane protein